MAEAPFKGVFPVHAVKFEICTSGDVETAGTYTTVADIESLGFAPETGVEAWNSITTDGWQRALATSKSIKFSLSGKRNIGDPGNDYIASKAFLSGRDCESRVRITFPDGAIFEIGVVISVTECGGGNATSAGPLACDLTSNGKPTYTPAA